MEISITVTSEKLIHQCFSNGKSNNYSLRNFYRYVPASRKTISVQGSCSQAVIAVLVLQIRAQNNLIVYIWETLSSLNDQCDGVHSLVIFFFFSQTQKKKI